MNVTIVIPALNAATTLSAQLSALDAQEDAPLFSVIVVDNGSEDETAVVARSFEPLNFDLEVVQEAVRGINSARNAGVLAAPMEWSCSVMPTTRCGHIGLPACRAQ